MGFLMPPHPLKNFEIQKYYENEPRFIGVFSRDNFGLDWTYGINVDEYADVSAHWIALFCNRSEIAYFNCFGVEQKFKNLSEKNIIANIFRVQANNSVICGNLCIGFIDFVLAGNKLTNFKSQFSPYDFKKNDNIILSYFKDE